MPTQNINYTGDDSQTPFNDVEGVSNLNEASQVLSYESESKRRFKLFKKPTRGIHTREHLQASLCSNNYVWQSG